MGGRIALYYALHGTHHIDGLILESSSPGIADEDDRIERIQIDQARAKVLEIAGLEIFVNDWEKLPLFQSQYGLSTEIKQKIRRMRLQQNRSEEHTSELQSRFDLVCRLLLEKKNKKKIEKQHIVIN